MAFRAAACTGALYHIELYLVCGGLPGLEAGVYQYGAHDERLRQIRRGDHRGLLVEAAGGDDAVAQAPATVVYTSTYWRNSWKYQARAYRHCFWDSGTILANTLAVAWAHGLPARVVAGFVDDDANRLLDLDSEQEVTLSLLPLGSAAAPPPGPEPRVERLNLATAPLSASQVDYPAIGRMHAASCLASGEEVAAWRAARPHASSAAPTGAVVPLRPLEAPAQPSDPIETVILRRGSSRTFQRAPISFEALSTMLTVATRGVPTDFLDPPGATLNDLYLIVNAVDGLSSGAYVLDRGRGALELLRAGDFRREAGYLDMGQELGADAAVNVYLLADLEPILERLGNRAYRAAQLEASIMGGKLYLSAYALGLGATGLTFFDDDVTRFFSPHAQGKSVMFLAALGQPARQRSS
jgi:SagB-type dehydrogenase family enzyme